MIKICDLHIHSKFSGEASKNIDIFKIANNYRLKGIDIVGIGDCLHPLWRIELTNNFIEYLDDVFFTPKLPNIFFFLQSEIEAIWSNNSSVKKVHFILLFPNFDK
ncbi:MAG: hypothetical protein ACFFCE_00320 [Promethearchaeota archaeon]